MKKAILLIYSILLLIGQIHAQKARLNVKLVDSSFTSYSDYIFEVEIRNDSFPSYFIQDTAILREYFSYRSLLYVILEKKVNGKFDYYENVKRHAGDPIPEIDSNVAFCRPCIYLSQGKSLRISLPLLTNYVMEKGEYMLEVILGYPMYGCDDCEEIDSGEIHKDYYFSVR